MSTTYTLSTKVSLSRVLECLPSGIHVLEGRRPAYRLPCRCLTDGENFIWVYEMDGGYVEFERFGMNKVYSMLRALEVALGVWFQDEGGLTLHPDD